MALEDGRGWEEGVEGGEEDRRGEGREADEEDEGVERRENDSKYTEKPRRRKGRGRRVSFGL